jgi:predicted nucleic acid-binding protein
MTDLWADANILLRFLTGTPEDHAARARRLIKRAEDGEVTIKLAPVIVAEAVWVLGSFYKYTRQEIATVLIPMLATTAIQTVDRERVVNALSRMAERNVAFVDAYLAEIARAKDAAVVSFDENFKRLDVQRVRPE